MAAQQAPGAIVLAGVAVATRAVIVALVIQSIYDAIGLPSAGANA